MIKEEKIMIAFMASNMRDIVNEANKQKIKREDIVSLLRDMNNKNYILTYYK